MDGGSVKSEGAHATMSTVLEALLQGNCWNINSIDAAGHGAAESFLTEWFAAYRYLEYDTGGGLARTKRTRVRSGVGRTADR